MSVIILSVFGVQDVSGAPKETDPNDIEYILDYRDVEPAVKPESVTVKSSTRKSSRLRSDPIPSKYGFEEISSYMTPLKDQYPFGSCWAMSTMALAQINLSKNGKSAPSLSTVHLAYFLFNSVPDPLGGTENDRNRGIFQQGENYLHSGANHFFASTVLESWTGAAEEKGALAYPATKEALPDSLDQSLAYNDYAHLVNVRKVFLKGDAEDIAMAKKMIMNNGGLGIAYYSPSSISAAVDNSLYNEEKNAFYDPNDHGGTNHAVVIVGWDDNFPKTDFATEPSRNGAWLVRNSWANGGIEGNKNYSGYFWMSYDNKSLRDVAFSYEFDYANNYDHNYQYDLGMTDSSVTVNAEDLSAANVFTAKGNENLKAVSFATINSNVDYSVSIYKLGTTEGTNIDFNSLTPISSATTTGTTDAPGYYTVPLRSTVPLNTGDKFAVMVHLHKTGDDMYIDTEISAESDWYEVTASADPGQSYLLTGSVWKDFGNENNRNIRIKAFTVDRSGTYIDLNDPSTVITIEDMDYTGSELTPDITITNGSVTLDPSEYEVRYSDNIHVGTCVVTISAKPGSTKCTGRVESEFTIRNRLTLTVEQKEPVTYNGSEKAIDVKLTSNVDTDKIVIKYKGEDGTYSTELPKFKNAGSHRVYYKATAAAAGCTNEVSGDFTYTVDPKPLTITWSDAGSWKYDGEEHGVSPTIDGIVSGDDVIAKTESLRNVNAGEHTAKIKSLDGSDKNNYTLPTSGTTKSYSIAKRSITITSRSASSEYTGNELKKEEYDVSGDGFIGDEGVDVVFTGGRTAPGESANEFTYTFKSNTRAANYETPVCHFGTLTVGWWPDDKKNLHTIVVSALDKTFDYNGNVQTASGLDEDTLEQELEGEEYTISNLTAEGSGKDIGTYPITITGTPVVKDSDDNDVSSHFSVVFDHGVLTIKAKNLSSATISLGDELYYTGSEQTQSFTVTVDGRTLTKGTDYEVTGDKASSAGDHTLTITGKGGYTGSASKTYTIKTKSLSGVEVSQTDSLTYTGSSQRPNVRTSSDQSGVTFTYATSSDATYTSELPSFTKAGEHTIYYKAEKTGYTSATGSFKITINKAKLGIEWSGTSFTHDGYMHVPTAKATGVKGSDSIKLDVLGATNAAGTHTAKVTGMSGSGSENYELPSDREVKFTITKSSDSGSGSSSGNSTSKSTGNTSNSSSGSKTTASSGSKSTASSGSKNTASSGSKSTASSGSKSTASSGSKSTASSGNKSDSDSSDKKDNKDSDDKKDNKSTKSENSKKEESKNEVKLADNEEAIKAALGEEKFNDLKEKGELPSVRLETKVLDPVPDKEKKLVEASIGTYESTIPNLTVGEYYDISLELNEDGEWKTVSKPDGTMQIVFTISNDMRDKADAFFSLHLHGGEASLLYDVDDSPETATFNVDGFSTFVLMYQSKEVVAEAAPAETTEADAVTVSAVESAPDTGSGDKSATPATSADNDMWRLWVFGIVLLVILVLVFLCIKGPQLMNKDKER